LRPCTPRRDAAERHFLEVRLCAKRFASLRSGVTGIYGHGEHKLKGSGCDTDCPSVGVQHLVDTLRKEML